MEIGHAGGLFALGHSFAAVEVVQWTASGTVVMVTVLAGHATAPFQLTKYLLPGMKRRAWGQIVNIASIHGLVANPYKSAYIIAR